MLLHNNKFCNKMSFIPLPRQTNLAATFKKATEKPKYLLLVFYYFTPLATLLKR